MPHFPTVSVVMATYNGERFVAEQINSILRQTLRPKELIISDDASTDRTMTIVRDTVSGAHIPIVIIENRKALGYKDNFLQASLRATGDFIAFCDQDDIWEFNKLEVCSCYFDNKEISMIVHTATSFDSSTGETRPFKQGIRATNIRPPLSYDPWMTFFGFSMIFRRAILDLWNIDDRFIDFIDCGKNIAHDRWIMFIAQMVGSVVEIKEPMVKYRQHDLNLFGDGLKKKRLRLSYDEEIDIYISATKRMLEIVESIPDETAKKFPLFDRGRSVDFFRNALIQLDSRKSVYVAPTISKSLVVLGNNIINGRYKKVHNNQLRWRSILKDLKIALVRC